jgi:hypothetical protein
LTSDPRRRAFASAPPDTLSARDRQLVVDLVLEHCGAGELRQAILAEPTRAAAVARVREALGQTVIATTASAGESDRQGLVRWCAVADQVRHLQLALPF